jgi:hypothetical protein
MRSGLHAAVKLGPRFSGQIFFRAHVAAARTFWSSSEIARERANSHTAKRTSSMTLEIKLLGREVVGGLPMPEEITRTLITAMKRGLIIEEHDGYRVATSRRRPIAIDHREAPFNSIIAMRHRSSARNLAIHASTTG